MSFGISVCTVRAIIGLAAMIASTTCGAAVDASASKYYEDALGRYDKHDIPGAIIQLKNAIQADPKMLSAQLLLGKALLANGEVAASEVALNEALSLGVNRAEVAIPLANALIGQGKQRQLFERHELGLTGLPPEVQFDLMILRAAANADLGNRREGFKAIEDARRIRPDSPDSYVAEVPLRIRSREFREAIGAAEQAISRAPQSGAAWSQKGSALHAAGDVDGALVAYGKALELSPGSTDTRIARAGIYMDRGRLDAARADLDALRESSPMDPRGAYLRAMLFSQAGDELAAKKSLGEVVAFLDPVPLDYIHFRPQLLLLGGLAHFALGNNDKAKGYLEALGSAEATPAAKVLAQIYLLERNPTRAQTVLEGYLRANPRDSRAIILLSSAQLAAGRTHRAMALMEEALAADSSAEVRSAYGEALLRDGRLSDAIAQLERAYKDDPTQTYAAYALVGLYVQTGQHTKAERVADAVARQLPKDGSAFNLVGIAKGASGKSSAARSAFERAVSLDPSLEAAQINLARLDVAERQWTRATQRLQAILKRDDQNLKAHLMAAQVAEQTGQLTEAQRALERARDVQRSGQADGSLALIDFHLRRGRAAEALAVAKEAYSRAPLNFAAIFAYARVRATNGDVEGARISLKDASRVADTDIEKLLAVAVLQNQLGDFDNARYSLEKILATRANFLPADALLAEVDLRAGDKDKAEARARRILDREPKRGIGYALLGDIAARDRQSGKAVEWYRRSHDVEPDSASFIRLFRAMFANGNGEKALSMGEGWLKGHRGDVAVEQVLADGYASVGRYEPARRSYERILAAQPNSPTVLNNLANIQLALGDAKAAQQIAARALKVAPENANVIDTLGWSQFLLGQHDEALARLRDARLRMPSNATIRYHLGAVLAKLGRVAEARVELSSAIDSGAGQPWHREAKRLLDSLTG